MLTIGITGSFGTGKSTVAKMFAKLGAKHLDADKITHRLISPNGLCYRRIVREFGKDILKGSKIDRRKLAAIVFKSKAKRKRLERIIHPKVRSEVKRRIRQLRSTKRTKAVVCDIPLLFESKHYQWLDVTVVVKSNRRLQVQRVKSKSKLTQAEINRRIESQMPITAKIKKADYVIDNRGNRANTNKQVKRIWKDLITVSSK